MVYGSNLLKRSKSEPGKTNTIVKLDDAVKETVGYNDCSVISDFHLSNLRSRINKDSFWECKAVAKLEDYEYLFRYVHEFSYPDRELDELGHTKKKASKKNILDRMIYIPE